MGVGLQLILLADQHALVTDSVVSHSSRQKKSTIRGRHLCLLAFEVAALALQVRSLSARLAADVDQANVRFSVILEEGVLIRGVHLHVLGCLFGGPCRVVE